MKKLNLNYLKDGYRNEEIVLDYANKGVQVPEQFSGKI